MSELVEFHLYVWLHDAAVACLPLRVVVAPCHVGEIKEIVAVVDKNGIKRGGRQVLQLLGFVGERHVERVALVGLIHRRSRLRLGLWVWLVGLNEL